MMILQNNITLIEVERPTIVVCSSPWAGNPGLHKYGKRRLSTSIWRRGHLWIPVLDSYHCSWAHTGVSAFLPRKSVGQSGPSSSVFAMSGRRKGRTAWL